MSSSNETVDDDDQSPIVNPDKSHVHDGSHDTSAEAAGVVRGVSRTVVGTTRSVGRAVAKQSAKAASSSTPSVAVWQRALRNTKSPAIGRIPRQKLPVKQVAKVSDRLSTGVDWWSTAVEQSNSDGNSSTTSSTSRESSKHSNSPTSPSSPSSSSSKASSMNWNLWNSRLRTAGNIAWQLVKNTALGAAVFETYGMGLDKLINRIAAESEDSKPNPSTGLPSVTMSSSKGDLIINSIPGLPEEVSDTNKIKMKAVDDDSNVEHDFVLLDDEYSRASLFQHVQAGFLAGTVHGVGLVVLDNLPTATRKGGRPSWSSTLPSFPWAVATTSHHALAHATLFGSYETTKRLLLQQLHWWDPETHVFGAGYLVAFGIAGGWAGALQHVVSHCTEQLFGIESANGSGLQPVLFRNLVAPTWRSTWMAFPPSAIGFIAFEYGKQFVV